MNTSYPSKCTHISVCYNVYYGNTLVLQCIILVITDICTAPSRNIEATKEIPALNQSWRGCNYPTSNWPYQGHQVPYFVSRTTHCLSPLWSNTQHWSYAPGVCSGTGMSWRILHSWLIEYPLRDNSRDMLSGIPARSGILLSDLAQLSSTSPQTWTT